ncbi:M56 family metallopeptidase [Clostridium sp. AM27-31LB]|uniref:M56 family metallopeptidase n=1 Tax=Clostridium sp. AM27-31LB TaxID=2293026 RepID=UPI0015FAEC18|nr:M56 family metallopeptidase [Clostridium sp. AM27-31LB]
MKLLYGLFYTSFSLAVVSAFALVVVLLIRFIIVKVPKKYFMCLWWLFLIRSICPVSLSSIYSLSPGINRKFHIFLELIGLSFDEQGGVLTGWQSVFVRQFTVNTNFRFCSIMWAAGVLFIWIYTLVKQTGIRKWLQKAERLDGSIYQHEKLNIPVMTGVFRLKKYLPGKMNVSEAKYVLRHMEIHEERHDGVLRAAAFIVLSLQWFNPFMWLAHYFILRDIETAADEDTLSYFGYDDRAKYAQEILNMNKGKKVIRPSLVTFQENRIDDRASKMLYQNKIKKKDRQVVVLVVLIFFIWWFMLRPLYMLWEGSLDTTADNSISQTEEPLFDKTKQVVVAQTNVKSADGLSKVIKIVMTDGQQEDSGYDGEFKLVLDDTKGNKLAEENLNGQFGDNKNDKLHFEKNVALHISDYNSDKVNEVAIGQDIEFTDENLNTLLGREPKKKEKNKIKSIQKYYIWNIEADKLQCVSEPIYTADKTGAEANSCEFKIPKGTNGVIKVKVLKNKFYYVWDGTNEMFVRKELTKKQLKKYKKDSDKTDESGEKSVHSLRNDSDRESIRVVTQKDSTGSEEIKNIVISPNGASKKISNIKGYYCELQWVQTTDNEENRYAVLTYNGIKSQTFVVFDTKLKEIYYKQEDGNSALSSVFDRYNGNQNDIAFNKDDLVVYTLQEKENDVLKIGFAANAKDNVVVKGSYKYDIEKKNQYDFNYSQTSAANAGSSNNDTGASAAESPMASASQ